jgi:hypothetical protein
LKLLGLSRERRPVTPKVAGSSPVAPAIYQWVSSRRRQRSDFSGRRVPTFCAGFVLAHSI